MVVIVLLMGGAAIFVLGFLNSGAGGGDQTGGQVSGQPTAAPNPTTIKIIVAAHDIRRGARLTKKTSP